MADADQQDKTSPDSQNAGVTRSELDAKLGEVMAQLQAMNATNQEMYQAVASAAKPQPQAQQRVFQDEDLYDAQKIEQKVATTANQIANQVVLRERELNTTIYNMAQEYPEIQSDTKVQQAVKEAREALPTNFRDTAQGLEMAILKAASKIGLIPKSKRSNDGLDPDFSAPVGRGSGEQRRQGSSAKVSEETLAAAELMGVNVSDPETVKRLEGYSQRKNWGSYR